MGKKRHYSRISRKTREKLIALVHDKDYTFKRAADSLKLNQSTARMIVRKFEKEGDIFEKK